MTLPTDVANLQLWINATAMAQLDGSLVSGSITDYSGAGHNATAVSGREPTMRRNVIAGKNALEFAGAQAINGSNIYTSDFTVFQLVYPTAWGGANTYYGTAKDLFNTEAAGMANDWGTSVGTTGSFVFGNGNTDTFFTGVGTINAWSYVTCDRTQSTGVMRGWINGVSASQITHNTNSLNASATWAFGGAATLTEAWFSGRMMQLITYSRVLTDTERQSIERYLADQLVPKLPRRLLRPTLAVARGAY
jgi:hypothetical protein